MSFSERYKSEKSFKTSKNIIVYPMLSFFTFHRKIKFLLNIYRKDIAYVCGKIESAISCFKIKYFFLSVLLNIYWSGQTESEIKERHQQNILHE